MQEIPYGLYAKIRQLSYVKYIPLLLTADLFTTLYWWLLRTWRKLGRFLCLPVTTTSTGRRKQPGPSNSISHVCFCCSANWFSIVRVLDCSVVNMTWFSQSFYYGILIDHSVIRDQTFLPEEKERRGKKSKFKYYFKIFNSILTQATIIESKCRWCKRITDEVLKETCRTFSLSTARA